MLVCLIKLECRAVVAILSAETAAVRLRLFLPVDSTAGGSAGSLTACHGEGPGGARVRLPSRRRLQAACLVGRGRAWSQRVSLSAGGRVRSMTIAAIAQAAHPPMESSAPMFGYHDICVGPASVCMVMPATPARVKRK